MQTMLLFAIFGVLVLALLGLILWFVPHLLHQQSASIAEETNRLRTMLLDLLNEQEAVTLRQTQLGASLALLRGQIEQLARTAADEPAQTGLISIETRLDAVQAQIRVLAERRDMSVQQLARDNEAWAYLLSLLATIQERVGALSRERTNQNVQANTTALLGGLEREMQHLQGIAEDIEKLQWRLRHTLNDRDPATQPLVRDTLRYSKP